MYVWYNMLLNIYLLACFLARSLAYLLIYLLTYLLTYLLDAIFCYRPSSVVCRSVCRSVGRSVTLVSPAKTDKPIEMTFGLRTRVGPRNHVNDGVQIPHAKEQLWGKLGAAHLKYRDSLPWTVQKRLNRSRRRLGCGLGWTTWSKY